MAIATITPQNPISTNILAQALNQGVGSLQAALNSAIQRGQQDVANQIRQEQDFLTEQQRNIANERAERAQMDSTARFLMEFGRATGNDRVRNEIAQADQAIRERSDQRADTLFGFQQEDRALAQELGVTSPELAARQDRRQSVPIDILQQDRARAQELGVTAPEQAVENQRIARERAETERIRADNTQSQQRSNQETTARFDTASQDIVNRVNDPAQFETMGVEDLTAAFNILSNPSTTSTPEIEQARVRISGKLPQQGRAASASVEQRERFEDAKLRGELEEIRISLEAKDLPESERAKLRSKAAGISQRLQFLGNESTRGNRGNTFRLPTSDNPR